MFFLFFFLLSFCLSFHIWLYVNPNEFNSHNEFRLNWITNFVSGKLISHERHLSTAFSNWQVGMPIAMLRRVGAYFEEYLIQKSRVNKSFPDLSFARSSSNGSLGTDEGLFEQSEPLASSTAVAEKILSRISLQMHNQQQAWQVAFPRL